MYWRLWTGLLYVLDSEGFGEHRNWSEFLFISISYIEISCGLKRDKVLLKKNSPPKVGPLYLFTTRLLITTPDYQRGADLMIGLFSPEDRFSEIVSLEFCSIVLAIDTQVLQSDLVWTHKWPFQGLSDLQLGNQKVTLKKLDYFWLILPPYFRNKQTLMIDCWPM